MTALARSTVTVASRIMLPTYVLLFGVLGANYALTPSARLNDSPALDFASVVLPLPVWGCMFLAASAAMATALLTHRRLLFRIALWVGLVCLALWAVVFLAAAIFSNASPTACAWPAFAAVACYASDRSLLKGEV